MLGGLAESLYNVKALFPGHQEAHRRAVGRKDPSLLGLEKTLVGGGGFSIKSVWV